MSDQTVIVEAIGDVVAKVSSKLLTDIQKVDEMITGVHYLYGHFFDIRSRLIEKGKGDEENKRSRFPLIALFEDFKINHNREGLTGIGDLKILILFTSKADKTREQREVEVFQKVLYPIYYEFLRQLKLSGKFQIYDETRIQHDQINRPHWGDPSIYANDSYLLGEVVDGIELTNMRLETYLSTCLSLGANF